MLTSLSQQDVIDGGMEWLRLQLENVPGFAVVASAPYLFRPFLMLVVLAVATAVLGVLINLRQAEFTAETMVHAVFPGIVGGAIWRGLDGIIPGAMLIALFTATVLTWLAHRSAATSASGGLGAAGSEASSAIVLATFYAAGIVLSLKHVDKSGQLEALMFGRLLELSTSRMLDAMIVSVLATALILALWRAQLAVAFDREGARATAIKVLVVDAVFNCAVALVVCAASSAVGVLLAVGLLLIPGVAARLLARKASQLIPVAIAFSLVSIFLGLNLPSAFPDRPVSPQACVALSACVCLFVLLGVQQAVRLTGKVGK